MQISNLQVESEALPSIRKDVAVDPEDARVPWPGLLGLVLQFFFFSLEGDTQCTLLHKTKDP